MGDDKSLSYEELQAAYCALRLDLERQIATSKAVYEEGLRHGYNTALEFAEGDLVATRMAFRLVEQKLREARVVAVELLDQLEIDPKDRRVSLLLLIEQDLSMQPAATSIWEAWAGLRV